MADNTEVIEGRSGQYGLEGIGLFLTLTFFIRVFGDMVRRATNGRMLDDYADLRVDTMLARVLDALESVERLLGVS